MTTATVTLVEFAVPGTPQTKGNLTAFPYRKQERGPNGLRRLGVRMTEGGKSASSKRAYERWRSAVAEKCIDARRQGAPMLSGPVTLDAEFVFERPKTVSREHVTVKPDLDKLVRALLDPLVKPGLPKMALLSDDAIIVELAARKRYGPVPHVHVILRPLAGVQETL